MIDLEIGKRYRDKDGDAFIVESRTGAGQFAIKWDSSRFGEAGRWKATPGELKEYGPFIPLSPAPAEPAKAAGWKLYDRCVLRASISSPPEKDGHYALVEIDGMRASVWRVPVDALRPEAAAPAAAPAGAAVKVTGEVIEAQTVGDAIAVRAQCKFAHGAEWQDMHVVSFRVPLRAAKAYYVGRLISLTIGVK